MPKIKRDQNLGEIASKHPEAAKVMLEYGLHCVGCFANRFDSVEVGAKLHGMNDADVDEMLEEINQAVEKNTKTISKK
jgi:hybrid cluster-associated redox disulfide protein